MSPAHAPGGAGGLLFGTIDSVADVEHDRRARRPRRPARDRRDECQSDDADGPGGPWTGIPECSGVIRRAARDAAGDPSSSSQSLRRVESWRLARAVPIAGSWGTNRRPLFGQAASRRARKNTYGTGSIRHQRRRAKRCRSSERSAHDGRLPDSGTSRADYALEGSIAVTRTPDAVAARQPRPDRRRGRGGRRDSRPGRLPTTGGV